MAAYSEQQVEKPKASWVTEDPFQKDDPFSAIADPFGGNDPFSPVINDPFSNQDPFSQDPFSTNNGWASSVNNFSDQVLFIFSFELHNHFLDCCFPNWERR